jgi:hypothetical protein
VSGEFKISITNVYPNPYVNGISGLVYFAVTASGTITSATVDIYSSALRHVRREEADITPASGRFLLSLPARKLAGLASGSYYCVVKARDASGRTTTSKPAVFIILK